MTSGAELLWSPPQYIVSKVPRKVYESNLLQENSSCNYARSAKWCPDGSMALASCENGALEYLDLPVELLDNTLTGEAIANRKQQFQQPAPVVDYAWYPNATSRDPASFCFVASVRECPVKLLDGNDGRLRASYSIVDHRERQIAPHALAFNPTASKLYCGFEDAIEVFDFLTPGEGTRLRTTPSKKSRDGLKGIVSSIAFSADTSSGIYAAGTLSPSPPMSSNIALFTEANGEVPIMFVGDESNSDSYGIRASVMQLLFNPTKPYLLYASFRRVHDIYCWDLRGDVGTPIQRFGRTPSNSNARPDTNQKIRFDIDLGGQWLASGDQAGDISVFDLSSSYAAIPNSESSVVSPVLKYNAHNDAIGSVGFHPIQPLLVSVSGSRHFDVAGDEDRDSSSEESPDDGSEGSQKKPGKQKAIPYPKDTTIKLWDFQET